MAYLGGMFPLYLNGYESLSKFLSPDREPDPDDLRGGRSHVDNTSCVPNKIKSIGAIVDVMLATTDSCVLTYLVVSLQVLFEAIRLHWSL